MDTMETTQLFVGNLSFDATNDDVLSLFADVGGVVSSQLVTGRNGDSRGYALVEMVSFEEAANAIDALNGMEFLGRELRVRQDRKSMTSAPPPAQVDEFDPNSLGSPNLFIGNLDYDVTTEEVLELVHPLGAVVSGAVEERWDGRSRGFAIVQMATIDDAVNVALALNGADHWGRPLKVHEDHGSGKPARKDNDSRPKRRRREYPEPSGPPVITTRLFVNNIPYQASEDDLDAFFNVIGPVAESRVLRSRGGRSMGCAVIEYNDIADAHTALEQLQNADFLGRTIFIREDRELDDGSAHSDE